MKIPDLAFLLTGLIFMACNKDDDNSTPPVTAFDLLTSGTWSIDTIAFDADKNGTIDTPIPGGFQACDLDNTLTFNKDSTGIYDEGPSKCATVDPQSIDFGWQLKSGDSVINFSGNLPDELKGDVNILTLTNTQFILSKRIVLTVPFPLDANIIIALKK